jgi:putative protease
MEILSPAGSPEGLVASIKGGCDAVYLGGKSFSARAYSDNFSDSELEGAINYAHDRNVKVYVAVNTLVKDSEMADAVAYVRFLRDIHADAILVQDLGLLRSVQKYDISKHASTQLGIHTAKGLEWCHKNGIDRAVMARELTYDELKNIAKDSPVEVEVFVQGALCYCISGGCLFSSVAGGRSGNRGQCAQPCRKKYKIGDKDGFVLSSADLYGVDWLQKLEKIGVSAAKIEGRMRSQAYAYLSAKIYSDINKGVPINELSNEDNLLKTVFNRGFGEGYLSGVVSPVQYKYADNRGYLLGNVTVSDKKIDLLSLNEAVGIKDGLSLFRGDDKIGGFKVTNVGVVKVPFNIEDGDYDIYRTYDPRIDEIKNLIGDIPKFTGTTIRQKGINNVKNSDRTNNRNPKLSFYVSSLKVLDAVLGRADRVYFDAIGRLDEAREICSKAGVECVAHLPRFTPYPLKVEGPVMVNVPGQYIPTSKAAVYGSYHLNMFNSDFPQSLYQTTLSVEMSKIQIEQLAKHYPGRIEVMVFGRTEIMCTRDPAMEAGTLVDEKDFAFPVYKDRLGLSHFLNSSDTLLLPYLKELRHMGVDSIGIDLRKRPVALARLVAEAYANYDLTKKGKITEMCGAINYGAYLRGI